MTTFKTYSHQAPISWKDRRDGICCKDGWVWVSQDASGNSDKEPCLNCNANMER